LLSVGRLNVRKNIDTLILAFNHSSLSSKFDLYIVGQVDGKPLNFSRLGDCVKFLGNIESCDLKWLYQNADFFIFPSLDEGFGLPLIEAAFFNCRTIASDIPSFREIGHVEAFFNPNSVEDVSLKLCEAASRQGRTEPSMSLYLGNWKQPIEKIRNLL